jgi:rhamnopyranosyl-N-acetylglucosaminyl-diphospho-decaprenol beta-1,3/1,4-galactofuranosyltransferase
MNITAIIVTYNRKIDLLRCLRAVLNQTHKLTSIVIVDNASVDNTFKYIYQNLYSCPETKPPELIKNTLAKLPGITGINMYYEYEEKNTGGAGGFCRGMEIADQVLESDYVWMMDDDGYPDLACLEKLAGSEQKSDYIMPVNIDIIDNSKLSWPIRRKNRLIVNYKELCRYYGTIMNIVTPLNGVLLSKYCIKKVGYINKYFFIWGDDMEHYYRCKKNGIVTLTLLDAIFFHPQNKMTFVKICGGLFKLRYTESKIRLICLFRNFIYINLHYRNKIRILLHILAYSWLFLITRKLDIDGYKLYWASVMDAFKNDFTRHLKYL